MRHTHMNTHIHRRFGLVADVLVSATLATGVAKCGVAVWQSAIELSLRWQMEDTHTHTHENDTEMLLRLHSYVLACERAFASASDSENS